jgi:hypothetical protein
MHYMIRCTLHINDTTTHHVRSVKTRRKGPTQGFRTQGVDDDTKVARGLRRAFIRAAPNKAITQVKIFGMELTLLDYAHNYGVMPSKFFSVERGTSERDSRSPSDAGSSSCLEPTVRRPAMQKNNGVPLTMLALECFSKITGSTQTPISQVLTFLHVAYRGEMPMADLEKLTGTDQSSVSRNVSKIGPGPTPLGARLRSRRSPLKTRRTASASS